MRSQRGVRLGAMAVLVLFLGCGLPPMRASGAEPKAVTFKKIVVDPEWRAEAVATGDVNKDGLTDVLIGDGWFENPGWNADSNVPWRYHEIRKSVGLLTLNNGWHDCSACFAYDVNGDGWVDQVTFGEYHKGWIAWYENPRNKPGHWKERKVAETYATQCPAFTDLLGDGRPVVVAAFKKPSNICWIGIPKDLEQPAWDVHAFGPGGFLHGMGVGDVNGDGRTDVLVEAGWYEAPEDRAKEWTFHAVDVVDAPKKPKGFGGGYAHMHVFDVNGDGKNDVVVTSGHGKGAGWFEQLDDSTTFRQHEITVNLDNAHSLAVADINGNGLPDLVTGRRYYGNDWEKKDAPLYWIELRRPEKGKVEWAQHNIDDKAGVGSKIEVSDVNGDGLFDVIVSFRRGTYIFLQTK
jgi:hypothetical protein